MVKIIAYIVMFSLNAHMGSRMQRRNAVRFYCIKVGFKVVKIIAYIVMFSLNAHMGSRMQRRNAVRFRA